MALNSVQSVQEDQYRFPYHFIPDDSASGFRNAVVHTWGHIYLSYMSFVVDTLRKRDWHSLIDVGCGDGRLAAMLAAAFPDREISGTDYSPRAIALARAIVSGPEFTEGDITASDFPAREHDVVTCIETIEHIEPSKVSEFVEGLRRLVKPMGLLVVTVPSVNEPFNKKHFQHFTLSSLTDALASRFELVESCYLNDRNRFILFVGRLLANKYYAIREPRLLQAYYNMYRKNCLTSGPANGTRVFAIFRPLATQPAQA